MRILGLNISPHDRSAALIENGKILMAIEEERLTRVRYCINYDTSKYNLRSEAKYFDSNFLNPSTDFLTEKIDEFLKYFSQREDNKINRFDLIIGSNLLGTKVPINNYINIGHHLAHAAHAFYTSPYKEAAILVIDGSGDGWGNQYEVVSLYTARGNRLYPLEKITGQINHSTNTIIALTNSVGVAYQNASVLCGFGPFGEGKLMGLSSYDRPRYVNEFMRFCRRRDTYYEIDNLGLYKYIKEIIRGKKGWEDFTDIAASAQEMINRLVVFYAKRLNQITGQDNLCYAGGVALNVIANTEILQQSGFKRVYIPSAPGDNGISIGASLYGYFLAKNERHITPDMPSAYLGYEYEDREIMLAVCQYRRSIIIRKMNVNELLKKTAAVLNEDKIIAWFQGPSEFGPRALGHRSIFASPRNASMRDRLNKIKGRETFRPVAPIILDDEFDNYFICSKKAIADSLPYMSFAAQPISKEVSATIPAVIHTDNTSRLQTISKSQNSVIYKLIKECAKLIKVPVLINTSFNIKGEPIVETPNDAVKTFLASDIDYLALHNYLIQKI